MKPKCHLQAYYVKCKQAKLWRERTLLFSITIFYNYAGLWKCLMHIKPAFIWWSKIQKLHVVKYYYKLKECFSILIYIYTILIKYHLFLWFEAAFSASLLHSSMHGPSDIIIIFRFIINVGNSCAAIFFYFFFESVILFWGSFIK